MFSIDRERIASPATHWGSYPAHGKGGALIGTDCRVAVQHPRKGYAAHTDMRSEARYRVRAFGEHAVFQHFAGVWGAKHRRAQIHSTHRGALMR
jgi:hypothetical protein